MGPVLEGLAALVPPIGVGLVFWLVIRSIVQADRRERAAMAALDAQERAGRDEAPDDAGAGPGAGPGADDADAGAQAPGRDD
jgi:hypothetical protein